MTVIHLKSSAILCYTKHPHLPTSWCFHSPWELLVSCPQSPTAVDLWNWCLSWQELRSPRFKKTIWEWLICKGQNLNLRSLIFIDIYIISAILDVLVSFSVLLYALLRAVHDYMDQASWDSHSSPPHCHFPRKSSVQTGENSWQQPRISQILSVIRMKLDVSLLMSPK